MRGEAPPTRDLGPDSAFSKEFVTSPSVQKHVSKAIDHWRSREGGWEAEDGTYRNGAARFNLDEYIEDAAAGNAASHFVGSFDLDGVKLDDQVAWAAKNKTGLHSFAGGSHTDRWVIPGTDMHFFPGLADRPHGKLGGSTMQTIQFRTDLDGNPIGANRRPR